AKRRRRYIEAGLLGNLAAGGLARIVLARIERSGHRLPEAEIGAAQQQYPRVVVVDDHENRLGPPEGTRVHETARELTPRCRATPRTLPAAGGYRARLAGDRPRSPGRWSG